MIGLGHTVQNNMQAIFGKDLADDLLMQALNDKKLIL